MKKELGIFFAIMLLAMVALHYADLDAHWFMPQDREITVDEFGKILSNKNDFFIVMYFENEDYKNQVIVNCTMGIAESLGRMGKVVKNYALQRDECTTPDLGNSTKMKCLDEIRNGYSFQIHYGPSRTEFYEKKTVVHVDENFRGECALSFRES